MGQLLPASITDTRQGPCSVQSWIIQSWRTWCLYNWLVSYLPCKAVTLVLLLEKAPTLPTPRSGWDSSSHNPGWNERSNGHIIDRSTAKVAQLVLVRYPRESAKLQLTLHVLRCVHIISYNRNWLGAFGSFWLPLQRMPRKSIWEKLID